MVIDCKGKYIYPSFIDLFSDYGITAAAAPVRDGNFFCTPTIKLRHQRLRLAGTRAIKSKKWKEASSSAVMTPKQKHYGMLVWHCAYTKRWYCKRYRCCGKAASQTDNLVMIKDKAIFFLFLQQRLFHAKLPRQYDGHDSFAAPNMLDAQWYKTNPAKEGWTFL